MEPPRLTLCAIMALVRAPHLGSSNGTGEAMGPDVQHVGLRKLRIELFWLNLHAAYDLAVDRDRLGTRLAREVPVFAKASQRGLCVAKPELIFSS